jgi:carbamoyltransferase
MVFKNSNPLYYRLIQAFERKTGVPILLNTSFNIQGEPIVCSPEDAIRTFFASGLDLLVMGSYAIRKQMVCKQNHGLTSCMER